MLDDTQFMHTLIVFKHLRERTGYRVMYEAGASFKL